MYTELWKETEKTLKDFLEEKEPNWGRVLAFLRNERHLSQAEFSKQTQLSLFKIKNLEAGKTNHLSLEELERIARSLGLARFQLIQAAMELSPRHFFLLKKEIQHKVKFRRPPFAFTPLSLPQEGEGGFLAGVLEMDPEEKSTLLSDSSFEEVLLILFSGHLFFHTESKELLSLKANQSLSFDPALPHRLENHDPRASRGLLILKKRRCPLVGRKAKKPDSFDPCLFIESLKAMCSRHPHQRLSCSSLASLLGLKESEIRLLEKGRNKRIPWQSLFSIAETLGLPATTLISLGEEQSQKSLERISATERSLIDLRDTHGIYFSSHGRIGTGRKFFAGQLFLQARNPKKPPKRFQWKARILALCQEGNVLLEYGDRQKAYLEPKDVVTFDGSVAHQWINLSRKTSRLLLVTCPPLLF